MTRLLVGLAIGCTLASAVAFGFVFALSRAAAKERPKPPTGTLHNRMVPRPRTSTDDTPIFRAAVMREQERLRAELDDDAAVAAWLSGAK